MQYGAVLSRAWRIIWRNKIMWLFGFLAALGSGGGGGGGGGGGSSSNFGGPSTGQSGGGGLPPELQRQLVAFFSNEALIIAIVVALVLMMLVIALVVAFLAALGHGALVEMAREADDTDKTSFRTGWRVGLRRMFPVFVIRFVLGLPPFLIMLAGMIPFLLSFIPLAARGEFGDSPEALFAGGMLVSLLACLAPACCISLLLMIPLGVLETLSIRALVLEDQGILGGIRRGWGILMGNLGEVAVVWLIFVAIGIGVGIVIGVPMAMIGLVVLLPLVFAVIASPIFLIPLLLVVLVLGLLSVALRGVVEAYTSTVWTLAYRQFASHSALAPAMA